MGNQLSALSIKDKEGNWIRMPGLIIDDPTQEEINYSIEQWLNDHPEATTTVGDGAISFEKLNSDLKTKANKIDLIERFGSEKPTAKCVYKKRTEAVENEGEISLSGLYALAGESYYQTYKNLQGACYNSNRNVFVIALTTVDNFDLGILVEIDLSYSVVRRSGELHIGHANDLTYNRKTNEIYVAPGTQGENANNLIVIDADTLEQKTLISMPGLWNVSYDPDNDIIYARVNYNLAIFNSSFNLLKSVPIRINSGSMRIVNQCSFVYNGVFYFQVFSERSENTSSYTGDYLIAFDSDGNVSAVSSYLPGWSGDEIEGIDVVDGIAYVFRGHYWFSVWKIYLDKTILVNPNTDYFNTGEDIPSNSDLNSYVIPGKYKTSTSAISASLANTPTDYSAFTMFVSAAGINGIKQEVTDSVGNQYIRMYIPASGWSDWGSVPNVSHTYETGTASVNSASSTVIHTVTVPAKKRAIIFATVDFPSNATGRRMLSVNNIWLQAVMAVDGDTTRLTAPYLMDRSKEKTAASVSIRAYQNSGEALTVTYRITTLLL